MTMTLEEFKSACTAKQQQYNNIKEKLKEKKIINIGILVCSDTSFQYHSAIREFNKDSRFKVSIFVIPLITKSIDWIKQTMETTYTNLSKLYKNVYNTLDFKKGQVLDISHQIDIALFCNIYDSGVYKIHSIDYLSNFALCAYSPYGYTGLFQYDINNIILGADTQYHFLWKIYVENNCTKNITKNNMLVHLNNVEVVGYTKMDEYNKAIQKNKTRKNIIISPHHTITSWPDLKISNFIEFSDFFLELPLLYPDIDFIFRPHPLLFEVISQNLDLWHDNIEAYLAKIGKIPNMIYDTNSSYMETFNKSDALIHDCGSFLAEYLYTEKPMLFIANKAKETNAFSKHGEELLKHIYSAYSKDDIINFIDEIIVNNNDFMKQKRIAFANKNIIKNYKNAGKKLAKNIKFELS